ncbi:MAG TPA: acyl-CoA desaturase [Candidatus Poseidoniales archaeon]|nr:acyl-CoA desaturase [Candidatus Poseidoniales archaeon]
MEERVRMVSEHRYNINWLNAVFLLGIPVLATVAALWHGITFGIGSTEVIVFVVWYLFCGMSITAGYHRLFSHRSYSASRPVVLFYSLFGAGAFQNSIIEWCSDHRNHHKFTDSDDDPYNALRGFFWSHMGWVIMQKEDGDNDFSNVRDLQADPILAWQHRHIFLIGFIVGMVLPGAIGFAIGGLGTGIGCFIWGGLLRTVFVHHGTFLINSAAHIWGTQPYMTTNTSKDSAFLSLFTFGEGYHNFHHAFQADYRNGYKWYHWDLSKWLISALSILRLSSGLKRTPKASIEIAKLDVKYAKEAQNLLRSNDKVDMTSFETRVGTYRNSLRDSFRKLAGAKKENRSSSFDKSKDIIPRQLEELKSDIKAIKDEISSLFSDMRIAASVV